MIGLLKSELKKICSKKIVWIGLLLSLLYAIFNFLPFLIAEGYYITTTKTHDGRTLYGHAAVEYNQEIVQEYKGILTDEKIQEMMKEYELRPKEWISLLPQDTISQYLNGKFYYEGKMHMIAEVYKNISIPLQYGYSDSWGDFLYNLNIEMKVVLCIIIMALSPVFAEEYQSGMISLILTSSKGKKEDVSAKIMASLIVTNVVAIFFLVVESSFYLLFFGMEGWDTSIQIGWPGYFDDSKLRVNYLTLSIQGIVLVILAYNFMAIMTLGVSYFCKNSFAAIIISMAVFFLPNESVVTLFCSQSTAGKFLIFFPQNVLNMQLVSACESFYIFGHKIAVFPVLIIYYIVMTIIMMYLLKKMCKKKI